MGILVVVALVLVMFLSEEAVYWWRDGGLRIGGKCWKHKRGGDTLGFEFCLYCREFLGLSPATGTYHYFKPDGIEVTGGWGYMLNGPAWLADKLTRIRANNNKYDDSMYD